MKRILCLLLCLPFMANAQSDSIRSKAQIALSAYAGTIGVLPLTKVLPVSKYTEIIPFATIMFAPSLDIYGRRLHGHLQYEFMSNSTVLIAGCFLNNDWDSYVIAQKRMATSDKIFGLGFEKVYEFEKFNVLLFCEGDADFDKEEYNVSVGMLIQFLFVKMKPD